MQTARECDRGKRKVRAGRDGARINLGGSNLRRWVRSAQRVRNVRRKFIRHPNAESNLAVCAGDL